MAQVLLKELTKKFDEVVAVDTVNLEISDREFVVLVGPSGCGKTTTLRMIAGLDEITEGDIYIGDPALDFTGILCDCGLEFTKKVLAYYEKPVDSTFFFRCDWYGKLLGFHFIEYGQTANKPWYITKGLDNLKDLIIQ